MSLFFEVDVWDVWMVGLDVAKVHQKLNGTKSQRTPFGKLRSCYTQVFSGSGNSGSVRWRFLGKREQLMSFHSLVLC